MRGSSSTNEVLVPKVDFENEELELAHHRERRILNTLAQLDVNVGLTERLTLAIALPFLNDRRHEHDDGVGVKMASSPITMVHPVLVMCRSRGSMHYYGLQFGLSHSL